MKLSVFIGLLFLTQNLFALCEGSNIKFSSKDEQALVCRSRSVGEIIVCADHGVTQTAEHSRSAGQNTQVVIKSDEGFVALDFTFKAFGTEPGMYQGTSASSWRHADKELDVQLKLDAWGSQGLTLRDAKTGAQLEKVSCQLKAADSSFVDLSTAMKENLWDVVKAKINSLSDINQMIDLGFETHTPLTLAIQKKAPLEIIDLILSLNADVNLRTKDGSTAMTVRSKRFWDDTDYMLAIYSRLLKYGADVNSANDFGSAAFLEEATSMPRVNGSDKAIILKYLLKNGANPNQVDKEGQTALFYLSHINDKNGGSVEDAKTLIALGVDPKIKNTHGESALEFYINHKKEFFPTLIKYLENLSSN